jgi:hypothetical protein
MEAIQKFVEEMKLQVQEGKPEEAIFSILVLFLKEHPEATEQVIEKMADIPHEATVMVLRRLLEGIPERKVRKAVKRVLYRLKGKGISMEGASPDSGASILKPPESEPPVGYGTGIDPVGHRLFFLVIPHLGRGITLLQGVTSDTEGILNFTGQELSRKETKTFVDQYFEKNLFPTVEMDASYVAFLFFQAYQLTLERKKTPPPDFLRFKTEIEKVKKEYDKPLIYSCLPPETLGGDRGGVKKTEDLLKSDLLTFWEIEEPFLRPFADSILEAKESKLFLNQGQRETRFQEIYLDAVRELYSRGFNLLYQRRLEETSYLFVKLRREEEAKDLLALACDLQNPWNPLQPNPFLHQLAARSIYRLLAEGEEKKRQEPSLILKP